MLVPLLKLVLKLKSISSESVKETCNNMPNNIGCQTERLCFDSSLQYNSWSRSSSNTAAFANWSSPTKRILLLVMYTLNQFTFTFSKC